MNTILAMICGVPIWLNLMKIIRLRKCSSFGLQVDKSTTRYKPKMVG